MHQWMKWIDMQLQWLTLHVDLIAFCIYFYGFSIACAAMYDVLAYCIQLQKAPNSVASSYWVKMTTQRFGLHYSSSNSSS